ncbi:MAG: three-helix bundle dimerization domain-containing protein [Mycobacterium sp.]
MSQTHEAVQIDEVIARVAEIHPDISTADITRVVHTLHAGFAEAKVREFVPLLVERKARAVLAHRQTSLSWTT